MLPPRSLLALSSTAVLLFLVDRITKALARLLPPEGVFLVPGIVGLKPEENVGIAFSLDLRPLPLTLLVGALILVLLVIFARGVARGEAKTSFALMFILVGAFGNFLDRLERGTVTDFLVLTAWPSFNFADGFIVIGAALLVINSFSKKRHGSSLASG